MKTEKENSQYNASIRSNTISKSRKHTSKSLNITLRSTNDIETEYSNRNYYGEDDPREDS